LRTNEVVRALFGAVAERSLEDTFDELADAVEENLDTTQLNLNPPIGARLVVCPGRFGE
jgi:hypothetical protein